MPSASQPATTVRDAVLLPAERFFVRRVALAPDSPATSQLDLALETLSPFAPGQLYHGYLLDATGREALLYAAHRRNFTPAETASWDQARAVLPAFATVIAAPGLPAAGLGWRRQDQTLEAYAWDGKVSLPAALLARPLPDDSTLSSAREALFKELRARTGLPDNAPVSELPATVEVSPDSQAGLSCQRAGELPAVLLGADLLDTMDVRDKAQLAEQRRTARRDLWIWRAFAMGCAGLAACVVLELGMLGFRLLLGGQRAFVDARASSVEQIKSTQELATRLGEMSSQQLRPFEMLAAVNSPRPGSIQFLRVATTGGLSIEVEAQTNNPGDVGVYEGKLKLATGISQVELRDPRSRDGLTTFILDVTFRPDFLRKGGGS